ncbi:MAG TPA: hypothetical protein PKN48_15205, partial [Bacteroidales bacterium]|nr:hypothetical protein [Bacteroidales bacterium]
MKRFLLFLFSFVVLSACTFQSKAQLTCDTAMSVPQMVQNYLLGPGVQVTNITYAGKKGSIAVFTTGTLPTNLG